jgi:hypothetical protein
MRKMILAVLRSSEDSTASIPQEADHGIGGILPVSVRGILETRLICCTDYKETMVMGVDEVIAESLAVVRQ